MRRLTALAAALIALVLAPAASAEVTLKLGTLAPDGSPWHKKLKDLADAWEKDSNGQVKLKIFPGGVAGNEGDMVRKMRIGQLQAAAITVIGIHDIDAAPQAVGVPGMITTDGELACVMEKVSPGYEKLLADKGFIVLSWGDTGWAQLYFKKPVKTPAEAKGTKMFAWAGDPASAKAWEEAGFQPVVISSTDMMPSLTTGMIEAFATSPIMAATARWYEQAKHMPDVRWGRLIGATVVTKEAWEKIPADVRPKLVESAKRVGVEINAAVDKMGVTAIKAMQKNGLTVHELTPEQKLEWEQLAEKSWKVIRGGVVPEAAFDEVKAARDACRAAGRK